MKNLNFALFGLEIHFCEFLCNQGNPPKLWFIRGKDYEKYEKLIKDLKKDHDFDEFSMTNIIKHIFPDYKSDYSGSDEVRDIFYKVLDQTYHDYYKSFFRYKGEGKAFIKTIFWTDIINEIYLAVDFYYWKLKSHNIDTVFCTNIPHFGSDVIFAKVCELLSINVFFFNQSILTNRYWIIRNQKCKNFFDKDHLVKSTNLEKIEVPIVEAPDYMKYNIKSSRKRYRQSVENIILFVIRSFLFYWLYKPKKYVRNFHRLFLQIFPLPETRRGKFIHQLSEDYEYIYFPLHLQPELTVDYLGKSYGDQLLAIEFLSSKLPSKFKILVKENPKQSLLSRGLAFTKRLRAIPNVEIMDIGCDSFQLIKQSKILATITGTAGWEAIRLGKPTIVFGDAWYAEMPGVFRSEKIQSKEDIIKIGEHTFSKESLRNEFNKLQEFLHEGVIDYDYVRLTKGFDYQKNTKVVGENLLALLNESTTAFAPASEGIASRTQSQIPDLHC